MRTAFFRQGLLAAAAACLAATPGFAASPTAGQPSPTPAPNSTPASAPTDAGGAGISSATGVVDEVQVGDRRLTCDELVAQINQMNDIAATHGANQNPLLIANQNANDREAHNVLNQTSRSVQQGLANSHAFGAIPFVGSIAAIGSAALTQHQTEQNAAQAMQAQQQAQVDGAIRSSAQRRHDRLMQMYTAKNC
jgi:hypothetical protein